MRRRMFLGRASLAVTEAAHDRLVRSQLVGGFEPELVLVSFLLQRVPKRRLPRRIALKINLPHFFYTHLVIAATYGQLAEHEAAHEALRELLVLKPDIVLNARDALARWYPPDLVEQLIDGLRKAGLDIAHR